MSLSLADTQTINEIAETLYPFLPGNPNPYADQYISFSGVAGKFGLANFWSKGSKLPALSNLLALTLEYKRSIFCDLIEEIVRVGLMYRKKKDPITKEEIRKLNDLIKKIGYKIPSLWDPAFIDNLPSKVRVVQEVVPNQIKNSLPELQKDLIRISKLESHERGFAFEKFLNDLFAFFGLAPRGSFRLVGEQIDGSFQIGTDIYLLEAKWHQKQIGHDDLLIFREKVESKSAWSRGLFISDSGFTKEGLEAFSRGRSTNIIGMLGQDLYFILAGQMSLVEAINRKARRAAETGQFLVSVYELMKE